MPPRPLPQLLPTPKSVRAGSDEFNITDRLAVVIDKSCIESALAPARQLCDEIEAACRMRPEISAVAVKNPAITLSIVKGPAQGYVLSISAKGVKVAGSDAAGLYYGIQTLRQIVRQTAPKLPGLTIKDSPEIGVRGFFHDATRGKVPTLRTLYGLVDTLAHYKINQLHLYVEHSYAFRNHPDIWVGADPLTAEDVLQLDAYCQQHHVELVPAIATFGHLYAAVCSPRKQHLNELPGDASQKPFSWFDRMGHYTLNPSDPGSIKLVEEMVAEYAALHSSDKFNICCDETFDLGKGKSKALAEKTSIGKIYVTFLKKVLHAVAKAGKQPLFWGDVVLEYPEVIPELPKNATVLNWRYLKNVDETNTRIFGKAGVPFYNCPGVQGWNQFVNDIDAATSNILRMTQYAQKYKAIGLLNTDWGDYGHVNHLACSYHGMILGGAAAWNLKASKNVAAYDKAFSMLELGDATGKAASLWRQFSKQQMVCWLQPSRMVDATTELENYDSRDPQTRVGQCIQKLNGKRLAKVHANLGDLHDAFAALGRNAKPRDPLAWDEIQQGMRGNQLMHAVALLGKKACGQAIPKTGLTNVDVADHLRRFDMELSERWMARNKLSEYHRIRLALGEIANLVDRWAK